jgi:purine-binding chemotaxis protein CheW
MMSDCRSFCTFHAAGRLFGIELADIKEISTETYCTHVPHSPESVRGLVNIRGTIVLALDLRSLLHLPKREESSSERLVIFKAAVGPSFGLLVDSVDEIVSVPMIDLVDPTGLEATEPQLPDKLIKQACTLPDRLLLILNPHLFLSRIAPSL